MKSVKCLLYGHQDFIRTMTTCPTTHQPFSGSNDHTIRSWDVKNSVCDRVLMGHDSTITGLSVLKRNVLVSCSEDHTVRVWDTRMSIGGECVHKVHHVSNVNGVTSWNDLNSTTRICDDDDPSLTNNKNEHVFYSVGQDMKLNGWDVRKMSDGEEQSTQSSLFQNYSFDIMSGQSQQHHRTRELWYGESTSSSFGSMNRDSTEEACIRSISTNFGTPYCCTVGSVKGKDVVFVGSKNGGLHAIGLDGNDPHTCHIEQQYEGHHADVTCLSFRGDVLLSGDSNGTVNLYRGLDVEKPTRSLSDHSSLVSSCQIMGDCIWTGSHDGTIKEYLMVGEQMVPKRTIERLAMQIFAIRIGRNGLLYCGSDEEAIRCWDVSLD